MTTDHLWLSGNDEADELLTRDDFALLVGMLLDQQVPMETAFAGPWKIEQRLGAFSPAAIAAVPAEEFVELCRTPPAVHRYPGSMAGRIQDLARAVVEQYGGETSGLWRGTDGTTVTGAELLARLRALPGFGDQKARIMLALLGKQRGVDATGWREAAGDYGLDGFRSIADVRDAESLHRVRETKQAAKATARAARG
ncbi:MAG: Fe-S cluster assembly protein HesB [Salana multivorans]|uniref:HhH-GPD-type base excision DNA repair protein n=1 Tax=Salana multivorans TaxID=120377 RepID=UPI000969F13E|nr:HhH-GPD-type base excision DNA repair protein [Salana multivorans]MBN8882828.1 Fe-S cluster assembly protein HesB [Salana multivorans]OJX94814.1 MAG: Fe-S cluster assembly protein HesB [Micrococcales bacterium 73-15]